MIEVLERAWVSPGVWQQFPDYTAIVLAVTNLRPGKPSAHSQQLLATAENSARSIIGDGAVQDLPEVVTWREAYASFGVKPREARSSVESLLRRVDRGLPRIDRLTDIYNAVSVLHRIPIGGEHLAAYVGPPRLVITDGSETFDTVVDGDDVEEPVTAGEIVWRDDAGVTCRRWNWRQCVRTRLGEETDEALFILDGLGPDAGARAHDAADVLLSELRVDSPELVAQRRCMQGIPSA